MSDLKQQIQQLVREMGGEVGFANIERFAGAPRQMHPKNVFPECKTVISIIAPFPRGTYRGITEGTHWSNYTYYSYNRLNTLFRPLITMEAAALIEDNHFEAVPVFPGVPERSGSYKTPISPGRPVPDVNINVRIQAVACGMGEIGWSKVFISPKWGPRVRIGTILTDAVIEPDPLIKPGTLCNRCMKCVRECPGNAIPKPGDRPSIKIKIDDIEYEWGDVHMGRCTLTHHGLNYEISPFMKRSLPGVDMNVRTSTVSEEVAYRMTYTLAQGGWPASEEIPFGAIMPFYKQIMEHVGYFAVCGAKGCVRACMDVQERTKNIDQCGFKTKVFERPQWKLTPPCEDATGGIAEGKFPKMYNDPDEHAGEFDVELA